MRIANKIFILLAIATVSVAGTALAEQGFSLIGTWEAPAPEATMSFTLNPNGTFYAQYCTAGRYGSGCVQWRGTYRATGVSSYSYITQAFQGAGQSCPPQRGELPGSNGCGLAQSMGVRVGKQQEASYQMQSQYQIVDSAGTKWRRTR
jgi:hypothetical protein